MNTDIQQAINVEKTFNNKNNLLVTFHNHEINENSFMKLHNVKNIHSLEPDFIPKTRYIIELKDLSEADRVKEAIIRSHYKKGYLTINFMDHCNDNYKNIDPYRLHVRNLPMSVTNAEIKMLYPLCTEYHYIKSDSRLSKSILAHFSNVRDAISSYKITNRLLYRSNNLKVQFYRDKSKVEDSNDEENTDSEDDISKWEQIENDCLRNKQVSNTLLIKNFPSDTTGAEILKLYPDCCEYNFLYDSSNKTKSALVRFKKVEDAKKTYTMSNNIFKSNILHFEFYYNSNRQNGKMKLATNTDNIGIEDRENYQEPRSQHNSNLEQFEQKLKEEGINIKNVDTCVLHVENLPFGTTNDDLLELFPEHQQYQIIPENSKNSSSAYVCFCNPYDALQAYQTSKNKLYKRRMLSVKFKSKKLKLNPFALLKRKSVDIEDNDTKRVKIKTKLNDSENDDVIVVEEITNNHPNIISEDDVECKSEDEDYTDDIYAGVDLELDELDNEDNISDDDFQGIELDDDTVLPLDEDDF